MRLARRIASLTLAFVAATSALAADREATNVVLMVADGAGFNTWKAAAMYEGSLGEEFHDSEGWISLALSAHALRLNAEPPVSAQHGLTQVPSLVYDPVRAWDPTPVAGESRGLPYHFAGYRWLRQTAPDSASTISSLVTGRKTYVGSINHDGAGLPIEETIAAIAHRAGMRVGAVSSVTFTHATPAAAAGAHQASRLSYCELAVEMLTGDYPDVIAGCGHPDYDNNGEPLAKSATRSYTRVGGRQVWEALTKAGKLREGVTVCAAPPDSPGTSLTEEQVAALESWTLLDSRPEIESLREGPTPERLLIVPRAGSADFRGGKAIDPALPNMINVGGTLQQQRGSRANPKYTDPGYDPKAAGVPSLETLTRVALNALDDAENGFFLHVEGGAVDWAMHSNQMGRMVEEMIDFKRSVASVIDWIEDHGGWGRTLLIVTADHDHMLWGPNAESIPFDPLRDNGKGRLPSYRWLSRSHSNSLVPLFARGAGAERFESLLRGDDPFYGPYTDQTDVFRVMKAALATDAPTD